MAASQSYFASFKHFPFSSISFHGKYECDPFTKCLTDCQDIVISWKPEFMENPVIFFQALIYVKAT